MKQLGDENFRNAIIRGLRRRNPGFDILRAQDIEKLSGETDRTLLWFATTENQVGVTQDLSTTVLALHSLLRSAPRCTPIVFVPDSLPVSAAIDDLLLLDECATVS